MFDDLRNDSQSAQFSDDDLENLLEPPKKKERKSLKLGSGGKILGLNASQRFILSFLLLTVTCLGGIMLLLVTGKIMLF
jgi:hypothetical protein